MGVLTFDEDIFCSKSLKEYYSIIEPRNSKNYFADPFIQANQNGLFVFMEEYDAETSRGRIVCVDLSERITKESIVVIQEEFHLSFPYIFEYRGELYMCPESSASASLRVYVCETFPYNWKLKIECLQGEKLLDPIIFFSRDKWWLLANSGALGVEESDKTLRVFWAFNPIDGAWNEILEVSSIHGRNGGLISRNGALYRVYQRRIQGSYGEGVGVALISRIELSNYNEVPVDLNFLREFRGHHIDFRDKYLTFDYKGKTKFHEWSRAFVALRNII